MNFIVSAATDIGLVKAKNQDSLNVRVYRTDLGRVVFAVICDGMGGLSKGELASASVVRAFTRWADTRLSTLVSSGIADSDIRNDWVSLVTVFNSKIREYGHQAGIELGTTVTAILLTDNRYFIINVGDTRVYEISDQVAILTADQTFVAREVELGHMTQEESRVHPRKSVLLQCIGASEVVYPDMYFGRTKQNAIYMLCSDGFRHEISTQEIYDNLNPNIIMNEETMQSKLELLIDINKQRQERDNITAIAIRTF